MKPHRMRITHELVTAYGMLPKMNILVRLFHVLLSALLCSNLSLLTRWWIGSLGMVDAGRCTLWSLNGTARNGRTRAQRPKRATPVQMTAFHTDEYVQFLHKVTPETAESLTHNNSRCESSLSHLSSLPTLPYALCYALCSQFLCCGIGWIIVVMQFCYWMTTQLSKACLSSAPSRLEGVLVSASQLSQFGLDGSMESSCVA